MIKCFLLFDPESCAENSISTAVTHRFSFPRFQIFFKNTSFFHRNIFLRQFTDCLCKTGTHFSGRFSLFHWNPGCPQDLLQHIQCRHIFFQCIFVSQTYTKKIGAGQVQFQFFTDIFCRCFFIMYNPLLDIRFQPLRMGITSYGKKSVVYLQQKKTADFFYFIHIPSSVMMIMDGC